VARVKLNRLNIARLGKSGPVTRALARGAEAGARGANARAPRGEHDPNRDYGAKPHLDESYYSETEPGRAAFGSNVEHATYVELGTRYMDAQPHLRPAIDDAIRAIEETRP
jgi:hypothetical protein